MVEEKDKGNENPLARTDMEWTKELKLVREITAKGCTDTEFNLLCYMAKRYMLDPLKREVFAIKYGTSPVQIFAGRDGLLSIAHRTKQYGSMKTTCELEDDKPVSATCKIWRKDYDKPTEVTVYFSEYKKSVPIWHEKPRTMIMKVAEAACLRRAFNISGIYTEEEFGSNKPEEPKAEAKAQTAQ